MVFTNVAREIGGRAWFDVDRIPGNAANGALLMERKIGARIEGRQRNGVRIPLGDETLRKGNFHGDRGFARGVEIKHGSFHANGAAKTAFELRFAEMLDEAGQVRGTGERKPLDGLAVAGGDGSEGAPLVDGEVGRSSSLFGGMHLREGEDGEKEGGAGDCV